MTDKKWRFLDDDRSEDESEDGKSVGAVQFGCLGLIVVAAVFVVCVVFMAGSGDDEEASPRPRTTEEKIEAQFSAWDGSHRKVVEAVERVLNDPGSFEHLETRTMKGSNYPKTFIVSMEYTAKNAFGGRVRNTVVCEVSVETGDIVNVLSQ